MCPLIPPIHKQLCDHYFDRLIYEYDNLINILFFKIQGKNESLRARAILRSLVPLEDLQGVLSLRFTLNNPAAGEERPKSGKQFFIVNMDKYSRGKA